MLMHNTPVFSAMRSVSFDVKLGGDVKWKGTCTVDVYASGGLDVVKSGDAAAPMPLDAGSYDAVVACPSDEGLVKKTAPFAGGRGRQARRRRQGGPELEPVKGMLNAMICGLPTQRSNRARRRRTEVGFSL